MFIFRCFFLEQMDEENQQELANPGSSGKQPLEWMQVGRYFERITAENT